MKHPIIIGTRLFLALGLGISLYSCNRMDVGYLEASKASFAPDTLYAYRQADPSTARAQNGAPWVSTPIQGVAGTTPINYEIYDVDTQDAAAKEQFLAAVKANEIQLQGGLVIVHQAALQHLSNGSYAISLRVFNEDHSQILQRILTLTVADTQIISGLSSDSIDESDTTDVDTASSAEDTEEDGTAVAESSSYEIASASPRRMILSQKNKTKIATPFCKKKHL